ncbi:MAG: protein kinase [Deltaproteobacteria bacterium]|nr:protein kinase [Deltaproteobacteria bacterium]
MGASLSPSPDAAISIGSVLDGRYRIDAVLGTGGMGCVYRGEHTGIGRAVAIKVLHADLNRNSEAAQRFKREAMASGRLDHPNIVGVSDFGILDQGPCYLVMEALEGESLGARLEREKRIPWQAAVEILRGVLHGLRHAHDRGVVHRDIKPDNVFLARKDGEIVVKILDFGIAKLYAGSADDPAATRAGLTVGTPAYLSPEQAVGGEIKPASDLYSSTILLFEMITGRAPFEDKDPLAMLGAHVSREPPRIAEVAPDLDIPPALEDVIRHGLVKAQADRLSSATDYLAALDGLAEARGSAPALQFLGQALDSQALGVAPTARSLASVAGATPAPFTPRPFTPVPGTLSIPIADQDKTVVTPAPMRAVSLADAPALPTSWGKIGLVVIVLAVIAALALKVISTPDEATPSTSTAPAKSGKPAATSEPPKTVTRPPAPDSKPSSPMIAPLDSSTLELKALLQDLEKGRTCPDRRKAVSGLMMLGNKDAIPALKKARYRGRGGLLGIGASNTNKCLKADAEAAITSLGGTFK